MTILPRWLARLPFIRSRIFHPKISLRADDFTVPTGRYGLMPSGIEVALGTTVEVRLDQSVDRYKMRLMSGLHGPEPRFAAPIVVEGTDFAPLPLLQPEPKNAT